MQLDDAVDMMQHMDFAYHMEQGTKTMHANRWILQDTTISVYMRLKYFNACVSAVVCFGRGHCTLYKKQFYALDVLFRKLCRSVVTPPSDTGWSLEWREILHHWNDRARTFAQAAGLKPWSYCVFRQHCKLASHIANLPEHRWVRRNSCLESICPIPVLGKETAHLGLSNLSLLSIQRFGTMAGGSEMPPSLDCTFWSFPRVLPEVRLITCKTNVHNRVFLFTACALNGRACGVQALTLTFWLRACMPWCGNPFRAQGARPNKYITYA